MAYVFNPFTGTLDNTGSGGVSGVSDVSNVDGTLTISPTTGSVVASLNLSNANSWVGKQTFTTTAPRFSTLTTNGGIFYGNASGDLQQTGAGTATQVLHGGTSPTYGAVVLTTDVSGILPVANGGSGTSTAFTPGSVIFAGASGVYSQDNSNFYWDNTNKTLGIGRTASSNAYEKLFVSGSETLGYGIQSIVENTGTSGNVISMYSMRTGSPSTQDGIFFGCKHTILAGYGIVNGITMRPGSATQDLGLAYSGVSLSGTAVGPALIIKPSSYIGVGDTSGAISSDPYNAQVTIIPVTTTTKGQVIKLRTAHTATAWEVQSSAGTKLLAAEPGLVDPFGNTRPMAISFGANEGLFYTTTDTIDFRLNGGTASRGLRVISASVIGTNDTFFQAACTASGYGCFEGYNGAGTAILTYPDMPILFCPNRVEKMRLTSTTLTLADAINIAVNTTTGTKIGTATTQKLAFFNSTPIVQPANTVSLETVLSNLGLRASGTSAPLAIGNLTIADGSNIIFDTTTGTKIGTATTQKLAFFNSTPIVQPANSVSLETVLSNLGLRASGTTAPLSIGNLTIADGSNVILDTTTGTKFGTATTQKIGFLNATPIVQQANSVSLEAVLSNFGFRASGTAAPISVGVMTATTSANVIAGTSTRAAKIGGAIVDYYTNAANSGTAETDLYSTTLEANILGANGDKLVVRYGIDLPSPSGATVNIKMYFGGSAIFGTGALTKLAAGWMDVHVEIIRVSSTTIRYTAFFQNTGYGSVPLVGGAELAGLTLSNTNVIKITGQAGAGGASNDIVAKCGSIKWYPAA